MICLPSSIVPGGIFENNCSVQGDVGKQTLFFVEGTDSRTTGINWGDSFAIKGGPGSGVSRFLSEVLTKPYVNSVVISPHVYPP